MILAALRRWNCTVTGDGVLKIRKGPVYFRYHVSWRPANLRGLKPIVHFGSYSYVVIPLIALGSSPKSSSRLFISDCHSLHHALYVVIVSLARGFVQGAVHYVCGSSYFCSKSEHVGRISCRLVVVARYALIAKLGMGVPVILVARHGLP